MNISRRHVDALALVCGLFPGALCAQIPVNPHPVPYSTSAIAWPDGSPMPVQRLVSGDFLSQRRSHVVALAGGHAYGFFSPASMHSAFALPTTWTFADLTTLPSGIQEIGDFLVGVGTQGLSLAIVTRNWELDVVTSQGGLWSTATRVKASGTLQQGIVVGLASNNYSLIVATCINGVLTTTATATQGRPITDFDLVDWDGDGVDEIAMLCHRGLHILDAVGLQQLGPTFFGPVGGAGIAALRGPTRFCGSAERVAWVRPANGAYEIAVIGAMVTEPLVTITGMENLGGVVAADATGDKLPELLLSMPSTGEAMLLAHLTPGEVPGPSFSDLAVDKAALDLSSMGAQALTCTPGFFDIDFDRHADIVATTAMPSLVTIAVGVGNAVRALATEDTQVIAASVVGDAGGDISNDDYLWLRIVRPSEFDAFKWVDVHLWKELEVNGAADNQTTGLGIESESVGHWQFDLSTVPVGPQTWIRVPLQNQDGSGEDLFTDTKNLWGEVRFFEPGDIKATSPTSVFGCQQLHTPSLSFVFATAFPYFTNPMLFELPWDPINIRIGTLALPGRTFLGGVILPKRLPPVRLPDPPKPVSPQPGTVLAVVPTGD